MDSNPPEACPYWGEPPGDLIDLRQPPGERDDVISISRHPRLRYQVPLKS